MKAFPVGNRSVGQPICYIYIMKLGRFENNKGSIAYSNNEGLIRLRNYYSLIGSTAYHMARNARKGP